MLGKGEGREIHEDVLQSERNTEINRNKRTEDKS